MVHVDPLVRVVAPRDRPDQAAAAYQHPFSDPVELQDVIDAAYRLDMKPDKDWC